MSAPFRVPPWPLVALVASLALPALAGCSDDDGQDVDAGSTRDSGGDCLLDRTAAATTFMLISEATGSGASAGGLQGQALFVANQLTRGCGIDGTRRIGNPVEAITRDPQDNPSIAANFVRQASRDGQRFVVGAGADAPTTAAAQIAVDRQFPMGIFGASSDELRGCSEAQLADDAIRKVSRPTSAVGECWNTGGLVFRTAISNQEWSEAAVEFALGRRAELQRAALLVHEGGGGVAFAASAFAAFVDSGTGREATVTSYPNDASDAAIQAAFIAALAGDPEVLFVEMNSSEIRQLLATYQTLRADMSFARPSNFDTMLIVNAGSGRLSSTDLSPETLEALRDRFFGLVPTWESTSTGFRRWNDAYRAFDPDAEIVNPLQPRIYDALMVLALATVAAGDPGGSEIANQIRAVANPPGEIVYADDFATARDLLLSGQDINYEGASGSVDIDDTGGVSGGPFEVWSLTTAGRDFTVALFVPGTSPE